MSRPVSRFEFEQLKRDLASITAEMAALRARQTKPPPDNLVTSTLQQAAAAARVTTETMRLWAKADPSLGHKKMGRWMIDAARLSRKLGG
jgi:hypothetical protein